MSQLYLYCPHCASHLPVRYIPQHGTPVKCPRCQQMFAAQQVPAPAPAPLPSPVYTQPVMPYAYGQQAKSDAKMNSVVIGSIVLGGGTVVLVILLLIGSAFRSSSTANSDAVASKRAVDTPSPSAAGGTSGGTSGGASLLPSADSRASSAAKDNSITPLSSGGGFENLDHLQEIRQESDARYKWVVGKQYNYTVNMTGTSGGLPVSSDCQVKFAPESTGSSDNEGGEATGTAFVVNSNGVLMTCEHVVHGASQISVVLGGQQMPAKIVGLDKLHDLALLRVASQGLPVAPLANSDQAQLAEEVRAIGYPLSDVLGETVKVTKGSISGIDTKGGIKLLQIDASLNPGNSGGPLFNDRGEVLGINSSGLFGDRISEVGFAVPANDARALLTSKRVSNNAAPRTRKLEGPELARLVTPAVAFVKVVLGPGGGGSSQQLRFHATVAGSKGGGSNSSYESGAITVSSAGEIMARRDGATGGLAASVFEKLPAAGETKWEESQVGAVVVVTEQAPTNSQFNPFSAGPTPPFGRRGFPGAPQMPGGQDSRTTTIIPVVQKVRYEVVSSTESTLELSKRMEVTQVAQPGQQITYSMTGEGTWTFDKAMGLPRESNMKRTSTVTRNGVATTQSITTLCRFSSETGTVTIPPPGSVAGGGSSGGGGSTARFNSELAKKPNETEDERLTRLLELLSSANDFQAADIAKALGKMDDIPSRHEDVAKALNKLLKSDNHFLQQALFDALETWGNQASGDFVAALVERNNSPHNREKQMRVIVKCGGSKAAAKSLVYVIMNSVWDESATIRTLKQMGENAEEAVTPLITDRVDKVRLFAFDVLGEVGTEKCVAALRAQGQKEKNKTVSQAATAAIRKIMERAKKPASA